MGQDPLYSDDRQAERMAADPQIKARIFSLRAAKLASGFVALALIAAIWLTWRFG